MKMRLLVGAAVFLLTALVFSGAARHEFVRLDDYEYVVMNRHIKDGLTAESAKWAFCGAGYAANWHPLTWISHATDNSIATALGIDWRSEDEELGFVTKESGGLPRLAHIENILLHALNAVLLFALILCFNESRGKALGPNVVLLAASMSLLWGVHPLRVEVVAWVSERKELLCVFFLLSSLLFYIKGKDRPRPFTYSLSLFAFVLALLAKPVAVSLPVVIFAYEWALRRERFWKSVCLSAPFAVLSAVVCGLTVLAQTDAMKASDSWTFLNRLFAVVEAPVVYLRQTFWPFGLTIDYAVPDWSSWPYLILGIVLLAGIGGVVVWQCVNRIKGRENASVTLLFFAVAWLYVGLLPMIGIVKVGYEPHNDRYTYWIATGGAVVIGMALASFPRVMALRYWWHSVGGAIVLLAFFSIVLTDTWKDTETVFGRAVKANHDPWYAQMLAETTALRCPEKREACVELLRDVLANRHSPAARAILAYQLAAYAPGIRRESFTGSSTSAFSEARLMAGFALEESEHTFATQFACAALAFADYREEKYESAMLWMQRAVDYGYEPLKHCVRLDEWKEKANVQK